MPKATTVMLDAWDVSHFVFTTFLHAGWWEDSIVLHDDLDRCERYLHVCDVAVLLRMVQGLDELPSRSYTLFPLRWAQFRLLVSAEIAAREIQAVMMVGTR